MNAAGKAMKYGSKRMYKSPESEHDNSTESYGIKDLIAGIIWLNHAYIEGSQD
jgi:hypothetical protein